TRNSAATEKRRRFMNVGPFLSIVNDHTNRPDRANSCIPTSCKSRWRGEWVKAVTSCLTSYDEGAGSRAATLAKQGRSLNRRPRDVKQTNPRNYSLRTENLRKTIAHSFTSFAQPSRPEVNPHIARSKLPLERIRGAYRAGSTSKGPSPSIRSDVTSSLWNRASNSRTCPETQHSGPSANSSLAGPFSRTSRWSRSGA